MSERKFKISVVIPVHNEEENAPLMIAELVPILSKYNDYEVIFVDDGSHDSTLDKLRKAHEQNAKIHYVAFSKNFGHQNALRAGIEHASGDCIVSMDGDLQHPPAMIPDLVAKWQEGYDIVYTVRALQGKVPLFKKIMSHGFYAVMNRLSSTRIEKGAADFRLMDKKVADVLKQFREVHIFYRGLIPLIGFKQHALPYTPAERKFGKPSYNFKKNIKMALEAITGFSTVPLRLSIYVGVIAAMFSFLYGFYAIIVRISNPEVVVEGWTSVLAGMFFLGGIQLIMIGILGEYVGKLFFEAKQRPSYIIRETSL